MLRYGMVWCSTLQYSSAKNGVQHAETEKEEMNSLRCLGFQREGVISTGIKGGGIDFSRLMEYYATNWLLFAAEIFRILSAPSSSKRTPPISKVQILRCVSLGSGENETW